MNVEVGTKAAQFPAKEYMNVIFVAVRSSNAQSWRLSVSMMQSTFYRIKSDGDSPYQRYAESATTCISDDGESIRRKGCKL
jgi:hypothetical protein